MNISFNDLMKKIITIDDLKRFEEVEQKLAVVEEGYIFQDNQPTHVIMAYEKYQELMNRIEELNNKVSGLDNVLYRGNNFSDGNKYTESLETLLNKIGKQIFVDYYYAFKMDQNPEVLLEKECGFTINSCRSRSSSARSIFAQELQLKALESIISSNRLDDSVTKKAQEILDAECGKSDIPIERIEDDQVELYEVKIGKMVKGIMLLLLRNRVIAQNEIQYMLTDHYSKEMFNLNFPVLKEIMPGQKKENLKKDSKGYNRYYDSTVIAYDKEYLICSQWVDTLHYNKVRKWIIEKMLFILHTTVSQMECGTEYCVREVLAQYWPYLGGPIRKELGKKYYYEVENRVDIEVGSKKNSCQYYKKL